MSTFRQCCASWSTSPHEKHCHTQRKAMAFDYDWILNDPNVDMDLLNRCEERVANRLGKLTLRTTQAEWQRYFKAVANCYLTQAEPTLSQWEDPDGRVWKAEKMTLGYYVYADHEAMAGPFEGQYDAEAHIAEVALMMEGGER